MQVIVRNGKVERALQIFNQKSKEIILELRSREFYEKPKTARRRKAQAAVLREIKRKQNDRPAI